MKVKEIMAKPVFVAREDETLREVAVKMLHNKVGGLPVVNSEGKITGFLTESDFAIKPQGIPFSRDTAPQLFGKWINKDDVEKMYVEAGKIKVEEVMSKNVVYVTPEDSVETLIQKFMEHRFRRLPVVEDGKPIGMVSTRDLLKILVQEQ